MTTKTIADGPVTAAELAKIKTKTTKVATPAPTAAPAAAKVIEHNWGKGGEIFTRYRVDFAFRNRVMGGTPKRPDVIEAWLRKNTGVTEQDELLMMTRRTLAEQGIEVAENATMDDMIAASKSMAVERNTNGFKFDATTGLYIETRQIKAGLKECVNILFAGERWGRTFKGPKNYLAERVYVEGDTVPLGRMQPDGIEMIIGHINGPQGEKSTLTYHEYVLRATCSIVVASLEDCITTDQWSAIWQLSMDNGFGALRSQGHGRYDVTAITRLKERNRIPFVIADEA